MRSLYAAIAQVVGNASATRCIQRGSRSIGHQHPPTAAIVTITIEPSGSTASRECASPATTRPKAVPGEDDAGGRQQQRPGLRAERDAEEEPPDEQAGAIICTTPTVKRASSFAISVTSSGTGMRAQAGERSPVALVEQAERDAEQHAEQEEGDAEARARSGRRC